jgi:hypothetical protein
VATATQAPTYVYGVCRAAGALQASSGGIGDGPVRAVPHGQLAAVVSPLPSADVQARRADLMRHADVLARAFDRGTVVPLRFGTVFQSEEHVASELLEQRYDALASLLDRLEGLVELRVSAFYVQESILTEIVAGDRRIARLREATLGRPEAAARGLRVRLGEAVAAQLAASADVDRDRLLSQLVPLARDVVVEERLTELEILRASFLVDRERVARFDATLEELAADENGRMRVKVVGPLPPHSFTSDLETRG